MPEAPTRTRLAEEAAYLHRLLFDCKLPGQVNEQYILAELDYWRKHGSGAVSGPRLFDLITRGLDVEAIELYLRLFKIPNEVSRKTGTILYLCEVKASHVERFVAFHDTPPLFSLLRLLVIALRSLFKLVIGGFLVRRHHLV
ncbi:MAG: hypothetical protein KIS61_17020 [Candidatus Eremiobacteraeota bacterium]|nr:hypothetical protein [Candidatus Eremiobacteraeota bacterium]